MGGLKACLMCPVDKAGRTERGVRLLLSLGITLIATRGAKVCWFLTRLLIQFESNTEGVAKEHEANMLLSFLFSKSVLSHEMLHS